MEREHFDIAVVTVSTNKLNEGCLSSLKVAMDNTDLKVGFVLVDNGSDQIDARALAKHYIPEAIVVLRHGNHGFGRSCNRGAQEVSADYYFFLNPDTRIDDASMLEELHAFMKAHPKVGIAAPRIRYMDGRIQETCRRFPSWHTPIVQRTSVAPRAFAEAHKKAFLMEDYDHDTRRLVDWVQGSAFLIDGKLFHEIGGFDDRFFMYYEDVDLCRQCWDRGRPVYYLPHVELYHEYGKGSAGKGGFVGDVLKNRLLRAHLASWIKYTLKWATHRL